MTASTKHTFTALDGVRGLAALAVVTWHGHALLGFQPAGAYLSVDLFFILSGFVLAHAYDYRFQQGWTWQAFMLVRLRRLYPLYALALVPMAAWLALKVIVGAGGSEPTQFIFGALMLPTPAADMLYPLNGPAWSLLAELVANLAFGVAWPFLRGKALAVVVALGAVAVVIASLLHGGLDGGGDWRNVAVGGARVWFGFFAGVLIYRVRNHVRAPAIGPIGLIVLVLAVLVTPLPRRDILDALIVVAILPAIVLLGARVHVAGQLSRLCLFLGAVSYPIYVLHVPIFKVAQGVLRAANLPGTLLAGWAIFTIVVVAAWLADRFYDRPIRSAWRKVG